MTCCISWRVAVTSREPGRSEEIVEWPKRKRAYHFCRDGREMVGTAQGRLRSPYEVAAKPLGRSSLSTVIARSLATKQSRLPPPKESGLLRGACHRALRGSAAMVRSVLIRSGCIMTFVDSGYVRGFGEAAPFGRSARRALRRGTAKSRKTRNLAGMKRLGEYTKLTGCGGG